MKNKIPHTNDKNLETAMLNTHSTHIYMNVYFPGLGTRAFQ